ncbi:hypothetical protein H9P43_008653 [Blastocladiella emersonii ATCC 22665]|nr:hypothetical protein H9P43_008653 [Blastocladiella emersonii ATCC 22665]
MIRGFEVAADGDLFVAHGYDWIATGTMQTLSNVFLSHGRGLSQLPTSLTTLELNCTGPLNVLLPLAEAIPFRLETLSITSDCVGTATMEALAKRLPPTLKHLKFVFSNPVAEACVAALAHGLPRELVSLKLHFIKHVQGGKNAMTPLMAALPLTLEHLELSGCKLREPDFALMASYMPPHLSQLCVCNCGIEDVGLDVLGPNGPPMFTAGPLSPAKMVPGAAAAPAALVPLMAACTTRSPTSTSASVNAPSGGTTLGSTTSGSATTPSGPAALAVVQELDINLQEWDDVGSESDMTVVPASSSAMTKNKNITKIVVNLEANEEVDADEEESECESGPSPSSSRARKVATKAKGRDKNKTVKTPPASPTKRTRTSAVKGKSGAAVPAAQDDNKADNDDSATPPASLTKRARRGPAKGKGKDRSA